MPDLIVFSVHEDIRGRVWTIEIKSPVKTSFLTLEYAEMRELRDKLNAQLLPLENLD